MSTTSAGDRPRPRHGCSLARTPEAQAEASVAFAEEAIAAGHRALFLGVEQDAEAFLRRFAENGADVDDARRRGTLVVPPDEASREADVRARLIMHLDEARARGFSGLSTIGTVAAAGARAYEKAIADALARPDLTMLCVYRGGDLAGRDCDDLVAVHDRHWDHPGHFDDGQLRITAPVPGEVRLAGEIDHLNHASVMGALPAVLAASPAGGVLDLASLRFVDVAGLDALLAATGAEGGAGRWRLGRSRPLVRRLVAVLDPDGRALALDPGAGEEHA